MHIQSAGPCRIWVVDTDNVVECASGADTGLGRVLETKQVGQIADVQAVAGYVDNPVQAPIVQLAGVRTKLTVPMLKEEDLIGVIEIDRQEVRPFTDKQIELVQNFAAQAVIAIENTRLLNELRQRTSDLTEALEQQTATSEVLGVISSSPGELEHVFETILANATRLCEAKFANLFLYEKESFRIVAQQNAPRAYAERWRRNPVLVVDDNPRNPLARLAATRGVVDIVDLMAEQGYVERDPRFVALVETAGARTHLLVPMLKEGELIGAIAIFRQEVRPFTNKQIELVKNFAAQAVIAVENTRLLNELRQRTGDLSEALERQTATSDVLRVISSSPGDLQPVFEAILANATRICGAKFGTLYLYDGDAFHAAAFHNAPPAFIEQRKRAPVRPGPDTSLGQAARTKQVAHILDSMERESYRRRDPFVVAGAELGGYRTIVSVPMLKEDKLIGVISIYRQEVRPFADKQIALVESFAAEAVIAIENTRLLNELRESLQQQTATADVLKVISRSTFDLQSVLDTLVESAWRLC